MNPQNSPTDAQSVQIMRIIWFALFAMGAMIVIASYVVPNVLSKSLDTPANEIKITTLFTPFILSLALSEACTMMDFVTKIITNNNQIAIALFVLALMAFLTRFPVESKLRDQVEELKNLKAK